MMTVPAMNVLHFQGRPDTTLLYRRTTDLADAATGLPLARTCSKREACELYAEHRWKGDLFGTWRMQRPSQAVSADVVRIRDAFILGMRSGPAGIPFNREGFWPIRLDQLPQESLRLRRCVRVCCVRVRVRCVRVRVRCLPARPGRGSVFLRLRCLALCVPRSGKSAQARGVRSYEQRRTREREKGSLLSSNRIQDRRFERLPYDVTLSRRR